MASLPSKFNNENNINRSDLSTMYNIDQIPLARLRPEKFDDAAIQKQILLIQEICGDINLDIIAVVFHECDYNMQNTIARIKAGDFEDGGWQTAKSNNKKKNNNLPDQILNGSTQSDSEHSRSQHTSPTPSLRGTGRRQDHYHYSSSSRTNYGRRRNDSGRNQFIPSNTHYSSRNYSNNNKSLSNQQNSNEIIPLSKTKEDITTTTTTTPPPPSSSTTDDDVFILNTTQTLTYNNSIKKLSSTKRPTPSSIPQEPVSMHPIIQCPTEPIDIQFGDIQWNDSVPIAVYPSNSSIITESLDDQKSSSITNINDDEQQTNIQDNLSSNYINDQTTNDIDRDLLETTNRLSSSSISSLSLPIMDNSIANNLAVMSLERTSHLSDHLTDSLRQQQQQQQQQMTTSSSSLTDTTHLPPTSTSHNNNNSFISNTFSNTSNGPGGNSSAFTPYNTPGTYSSIPRDYSQAGSTWNQQSSNYKTTPKSTILQPGNYSQQASYQIQPQQQFFVGTYPYHPPTIYPLITQVDSWSTAGFDPYTTYPTSNYMPTYTTQQPYHPTTVQSNKYDRPSYDKDFFAHYGQNRLSNNELLNVSQTTKDIPPTSKLSATAASFSQGAPLTPTSPATAYYFNPVLYTVPTYYTSHHDRTITYPSIDNRDNRNGASYAGNNNRNHYHHYQHQRTHNNSTWHSQQ